jgi:hypothetical protein
LLSTPLHSDAVTFGYGVVASSGMDFHHADGALTGALIPAEAGIQRGDLSLNCKPGCRFSPA